MSWQQKTKFLGRLISKGSVLLSYLYPTLSSWDIKAWLLQSVAVGFNDYKWGIQQIIIENTDGWGLQKHQQQPACWFALFKSFPLESAPLSPKSPGCLQDQGGCWGQISSNPVNVNPVCPTCARTLQTDIQTMEGPWNDSFDGKVTLLPDCSSGL